MSSKVKALPELDYLKDCFDVDFLKGNLTWKIRPAEHFKTVKGCRIFNSRNAGKAAGSLDAKGYLVVRITGLGSFKCHKIIYYMFHGDDVPYVDHHNRKRGDNFISNLRPESHDLNPKNASKYSNNKSGITGVGYREGRWVSFWKDSAGKDKSKSFSLSRFGKDAFQLACEYRNSMIKELNAQGAGYTEQHGK